MPTGYSSVTPFKGRAVGAGIQTDSVLQQKLGGLQGRQPYSVQEASNQTAKVCSEAQQWISYYNQSGLRRHADSLLQSKPGYEGNPVLDMLELSSRLRQAEGELESLIAHLSEYRGHLSSAMASPPPSSRRSTQRHHFGSTTRR